MGDYDSIKKFAKGIMDLHGWTKLIDFNSNRRVPSTFVDQLWIHKEKKLWAFIEEKYGEDRLSDSQEALWCQFLAYSPEGMFYAIVSSEENWETVAKLGRS